MNRKELQPWQRAIYEAFFSGKKLSVVPPYRHNQDKTWAYNECLKRAKSFGELESVKVTNGLRTETYVVGDKKIAFCSKHES